MCASPTGVGSYNEGRAVNRRRGLTLVELLVVISILTMVTAATIPLMAPVTGQRKVRESARLLATTLAQAQTRALASGRSVGVWIERLANGPNDFIDRANQSIDIFLCETPPPYSGLTPYSVATVTRTPQNNYVVEMQRIPQGFVYSGDRIRFNYRGPVYDIIGVGPTVGGDAPTYPADGSLTGVNMEIRVLSVPAATGGNQPLTAVPPLNAEVPYQIFRKPIKTADEPVTLPVGALVDLGFSGIGNGIDFAVPAQPAANGGPSPFSVGATGVPNYPVLIMFGPSGNLDSVYFGHRPPSLSQPLFQPQKPITSVYLLVGQPPSDTEDPPTPNFINQDNVWVAVNPQSGMVTTSEVAIGADSLSAIDWSDPQQRAAAIVASRAFARSQQNMGGR